MCIRDSLIDFSQQLFTNLQAQCTIIRIQLSQSEVCTDEIEVHGVFFERSVVRAAMTRQFFSPNDEDSLGWQLARHQCFLGYVQTVHPH